MGDLNRLKELLRSLDCRSLDPEAIEAIRKIVVELNATVPGMVRAIEWYIGLPG